MLRPSSTVLSLASAAFALGCSSWEPNEPAPPASVTAPVFDLRVVENRIEDANGEVIVLRGVNRSGTEYQCIKDFDQFFDGPSDEASVAAMAAWNVNAVRVPLNESCWLAINGAPAATSGEAYKQAIVDYVDLLHAYGLIPILDLHWVGPGDTLADRLNPMPSGDHSEAFWADVAKRFKHDLRVVFEPFNEPFPTGNSEGDIAWDCWRDGCEVSFGTRRGDTTTGRHYQSTGMQQLVTAIRSTGATNLILLGGVQYSNALNGFLEHVPSDPLDNLAAAWHVYDNNPCNEVTCWDDAPAAVAREYPLVVTEFGQRDCEAGFVVPLLEWLDTQGAGYLAWSWNAYGPCRPANAMPYGNPWSLVTDYETGTPNGGYAQAYYDHLNARLD